MSSGSSDSRSWLYNPKFPDTWERQSLYNLADWLNGMAFRDFQFSDTGKPVIKIAELKNGITGQTKFTKGSYAQEYLIKSGDMLFAWSGQPDSSLDVFYWRGQAGWLNQHIFKLTPHDNCDERFFFYILKYLNPNFVQIARNKQTTGLGHVTKKDLERLEVSIPTLPVQREIAQILGAFDDKIELNRRMNETLEAMARALFKCWFVDFEPVRIKQAARERGEDPNATLSRPPSEGGLGLAPDIAALFPDRFVDSELGEIPDGWEVKPLDEVAVFLNGLAMQKHPAEPDDPDSLPVIKIAQLRSGNTLSADRASATFPEQYLVNDRDLLFSWSGSLEVSFWAGGKGALNQHLFKVSSEKYPEWFYYHWLLYHLPAFRQIAAGKATTMGHIQRHHLTQALTVVPDKDFIDAANRVFAPLVRLIVSNAISNRLLAECRDTLLPELLAGSTEVFNGEINHRGDVAG